MITRRTRTSLTNSKRINLFWVYKQNLTHKDEKEITNRARCAAANPPRRVFSRARMQRTGPQLARKTKKKGCNEKEKRIIANHFSFHSESKNAG